MKFLTFGMLSILIILGLRLSAQSYIPPRTLSDLSLLKSFLSTHMVYPCAEYEQKVQGTVKLSFLVQPDGSIRDVKVLKGITEPINNEAIRLLRKIIWLPASINGVTVEVEHYFTVKFDPVRYDNNRKKLESGQECYRHAVADTSTVIYLLNKIETAPEPIIKGGVRNLTSYLQEHLRYPEAAYKLNLRGTVTLGFVVEPDGSITNIHVIKAVGGGCEQEAIRLVQNLCWKSATVNGSSVRAMHSFDIHFALEDNSRSNYIPNRQSSGI